MKRSARNGFTLLEVLAVIAIIFTLVAIMMFAADAARRRARIERTKAIIDVLVTACNNYFAIYRDYPYPDPDNVGLGAMPAFRAAYFSGGWSDEGKNVALIHVLSQPRQPAPLVLLQERWFKKTDEDLAGPDGRTLYKVIDGFQNVIRVSWEKDRYYRGSYLESDIGFTSAGPDEDFDLTEDNIEKRLQEGAPGAP